jgi:putative membrane protein
MTLGLLLKIITLPLGILTLGLFFLVINAFILKLAGGVVPGFYVATWGAALIGALVLAILHMLLSLLLDKND